MILPPGCMGVQPTSVRGPTAIGVDVRPQSWDCAVGDLIRVKGDEWAPRLLFYGKVPDERAVLFLMQQYAVRFGCSDSRPDGTLALRLQNLAIARLGMKFWRTQYATSPTEIKVTLNEKEGLLTLDRTKTLDDVHWAFQTGRFLLPQNFLEIGRIHHVADRPKVSDGSSDFASELTSSARILTTWHQREAYLWKESGPDHAFHALNNLLVAMDMGNLKRGTDTEFAGSTSGIVASTLSGTMAGRRRGGGGGSSVDSDDDEPADEQFFMEA